KNNPNYS
ncbi:hypothetical protein DRW55_00265, partial [Metamycoplasma hominis]